MINKLFNNRYILKIDSFIKNISLYNFNNAVGLLFRYKCKDYKKIKGAFKDIKSLKMMELIDKRLEGGLNINSIFDMGYCLFGPVIYDFVQWLYVETEKYDKIWFLAREGWFLKKVFDIYCNCKSLVEEEYFLASRRAVSIATVKNEQDIINVLKQCYKGSIINLIKARFGVDINIKDFYVEMPKDIDRVMKYIDILQIIKKAEVERKNYLKYIGDVNGKIAVIDVGYSGTIQYYLSKLTCKNIDGLYLCSHYNNKAKKLDCNVKSLFPVYNLIDERENIIFTNQLYFEAVLQAPYGQLECFNEKGEPIYNNDNTLNKKTLEVQRGICKFIEDMGKIPSYKRSTFSVENFKYGIEKCNLNKKLTDFLSVEDSYCSGGSLKVNNGNWSKI